MSCYETIKLENMPSFTRAAVCLSQAAATLATAAQAMALAAEAFSDATLEAESAPHQSGSVSKVGPGPDETASHGQTLGSRSNTAWDSTARMPTARVLINAGVQVEDPDSLDDGNSYMSGKIYSVEMFVI